MVLFLLNTGILEKYNQKNANKGKTVEGSNKNKLTNNQTVVQRCINIFPVTIVENIGYFQDGERPAIFDYWRVSTCTPAEFRVFCNCQGPFLMRAFN